VRLASVRRSLFTDDVGRSQFLARLMAGTKEILQTGQGSYSELFFPIITSMHYFTFLLLLIFLSHNSTQGSHVRTRSCIFMNYQSDKY